MEGLAEGKSKCNVPENIFWRVLQWKKNERNMIHCKDFFKKRWGPTVLLYRVPKKNPPAGFDFGDSGTVKPRELIFGVGDGEKKFFDMARMISTERWSPSSICCLYS